MKRAAVALLAAGASLVLARQLPAAVDPLRGTLAVVPLVAAGLWWVGRQARKLSFTATGRTAAAAEVAALAVLALLALRRRALGFPYADEVVAAGLALLLAHRLLRLLPALRIALGGRIGPRPPAAFFILPLVVYLAVLPWTLERRQPDGDEPYLLLVTHSLAYDLDVDLTDNYARQDSLRYSDRVLAPEWADPVARGGQLYSRHPFVLPLVLAPGYRVAGRAGAALTLAALAALVAWMSLRLAGSYWPARPGAALLAWAVIAFTPPFLLFATQIWVEIPAAFLLLAGLDGIRRPGAPGWHRILAVTLAVVLLPLLKLRFLLIAAPLAALAWWRWGRPWRVLAVVVVSLVVVTGSILLYNQTLFGEPLRDHGWDEILSGWSPWRAALGGSGLLFDCAFGLFAAAPLWILLLPAAVAACAGREPLVADLAVCGGPYLAVIAGRLEWYGAWSPPFRFGVVVLPVLGLALVPLLARRPRPGGRALVAALAGLTLVLALVWLVVPGWAVNLADGSSHLLDRLGLRIGADVTRLFPSSIRPRPATWISPALLALLAIGLWWVPARRRSAGSAWGLAALLLAASALPAAAVGLVTRIIEFEDSHVDKSGGDLYPERWAPGRAGYRGGWVLPAGAELKAPITAGGRRLRLEVELLWRGGGAEPPVLEIGAGDDRLIGARVASHHRWQRLAVGPLEWPGAKNLSLRLRADQQGSPPAPLLLDRARLSWE